MYGFVVGITPDVTFVITTTGLALSSFAIFFFICIGARLRCCNCFVDASIIIIDVGVGIFGSSKPDFDNASVRGDGRLVPLTRGGATEVVVIRDDALSCLCLCMNVLPLALVLPLLLEEEEDKP